MKRRIKQYYTRVVVALLRRNKVAFRFITNSIAKSYDEGYKAGMLQMTKQKLGKKYVSKVKKVINNAYNTENLNIND